MTRDQPKFCRLAGVIVGLAVVAAVVAAASHASAEKLADVSRLDLDRALAKEGAPTRVRWLFRPRMGFQRSSLAADGGALEIARLPRFADLRILEAPIDSAAQVEAIWSLLGELVRDVRGTAALDETTQLVGAGSGLWNGLGLKGDAASTVAILDSGVDTAHDDLGDADFDNQDAPPLAGDDGDWAAATPQGLSFDYLFRVVGWHDVSDDLPQALGPYDYHYHGTAVASAAFGGGRLNSNGRGVAPEGRFVVVKTWNFENRWERWASDFLLGVDWVIANRDLYRIQACLVTTLWPTDLGMSDAVNALVDAGIAVICASGNTGDTEMGYPAVLDDVIAVGATNSQGLVASYSTSSPPGQGRLDLVAPGGSLSDPQDLVEVADNEPNDSYRGRVGTSLAAAHVAGAVSILNQARRESGRPWRRDRAQVRWLKTILRATAAETPGAEVGAQGTPRTNRFGADDYEGWGLLQIRAALGAVRDVLWVGEDRRFDLFALTDGPAVWAARMPVEGIEPLSLDLIPPPGADLDLFLYHEQDDGLRLAARSDRNGLGQAESLRLDHALVGWYVVVVKRVAGVGEGHLFTGRDDPLNPQWPLRLLSAQVTAPTRYDLDGDGLEEMILTNNLFSSPTDHRIYAVRAGGQSLPGFPRFLAGAVDRPGALSAPAVGRFGAGVSVVAAGETGELFAVDANGGFQFRTAVAGRTPTSNPMIIDEGTGAHVVVGTPQGLVMVDTAGAADDTLSLGAGVILDPAAADLDADGFDEIAVMDKNFVLHVVESDGVAWPGWPRSFGATVETTAPVFLGAADGAPPSRLAFARVDNLGGAWMHLLALDGSDVTGFPLALNAASATALKLSPISAAPLERNGPLHVLITVAELSNAGQASLEFRAVGLDASLGLSRSLALARREFDSSFFSLAAIRLSEPLALEWTSAGEFEFVQNAQVLWSEIVGAPTPRFGSTRRWIAWSQVGVPGADQMHLNEGRRSFSSDVAMSAMVGDLDGDGRTELYLPRGAGVAMFRTRLATELSRIWSMERGDPARHGCAGCVADVVVAAPDAPDGPVRAILRAAPNPFNPRTSLQLEGVGAGPLRWELFDARGRRLRRWTSNADGSAVHRESFDAIDEHGRPLASGSYFLRVSDGRRWVGQRITLLQ
jgi:subtilisin family serine protease